MTYTHEGWYWFVPIYASMTEESIDIVSKHWWMEWMIPVCDAIERARIYLCMLIWADYEPSFMFVLRELKEPIHIESV